MVNDFYEGEIVEVDDGGNYPFIYPLYTGSTYEDNSENLNFEVYVMENALTKKDDIAQQRNAVSDCKQIAEDIIADIKNGGNIFVFDDQVDLEDYSLTPAIDVRTQTLTGVILNLTIAIPFTANACVLPLEGVTPTSTDCADATYRNSDGSFEQSIGSGNIFVAADIEVEDVDGSTRQEPANQNVQCVFVPIELVNSEGDNIFDDIDAFPTGGQTEIPDFLVRDKDNNIVSAPAANSIQLPSVEVTGVSVDPSGVMTINTPSVVAQSGIKYRETRPIMVTPKQYTAGDSVARYLAGEYERTPPPYPERVAMIDYEATQADVRATPATGTLLTAKIAPTILKGNNHFGNRYAWTDDQGNPSDSAADILFAHVDWRNHSFTGATANYVIDHETGWGYYLVYLTDGTKFNLDSNPANGQPWEDWMTYVANLGVFQGYSGWMPVDLGDMQTFIGAQGLENSDNNLWARNFLRFEASVVGATRGAVVTGESQNDDEYWLVNDNGNETFQATGMPKNNDGQFQNRLANIFIKRKHF